MTTALYPNLTTASLRVLLTAEPGAQITAELVGRVTGDPADFAVVMADLNRVHMVDEHGDLTPLADRYAEICKAAVYK